MAYNTSLTDRIRGLLSGHSGLSEKKMFGGLSFLIHGNMCCGVNADTLVLRLGRELSERAVEEPHVRFCDFTGKVMRTMVMVDPEGLEDEAALASWVERAARFAGELPPK